jgi:hypothetical protein
MDQPKVLVPVIICFGIAESTMADLDEEYRLDSDDDDVVVAVKTNSEEEKESSTQRLLRELVAKKAKVDYTKQVWFLNFFHSLVVMKKHVFKLLQGYNINVNLYIRVLPPLECTRTILPTKQNKKNKKKAKDLRNSMQAISHISHYCR